MLCLSCSVYISLLSRLFRLLQESRIGWPADHEGRFMAMGRWNRFSTLNVATRTSMLFS